MPEVL